MLNKYLKNVERVLKIVEQVFSLLLQAGDPEYRVSSDSHSITFVPRAR